MNSQPETLPADGDLDALLAMFPTMLDRTDKWGRYAFATNAPRQLRVWWDTELGWQFGTIRRRDGRAYSEAGIIETVDQLRELRAWVDLEREHLAACAVMASQGTP